ncbi:MAG: sodium:proton antiporter [Prevotellaceae bacterium]|jgi:NhaC family Na+:H+ antiporter|nr:sodium:proton antiporter [Prevotellaceae bacterium]
MKNQTVREPSTLLSFVPIIVLVCLLAVTIQIYGNDALSGGSQIVLLIASAVCCLIAIAYCKVKWEVIEEAISKNIADLSPAILILLIIGALSGAWMISGIVPTLIYYGMGIIHPSYYLVSTCIICAVVSVIIGSSWTTIATVGVALLGVGQALGFSPGWIGGAIISGAYFGDKVSPLSDTTVLSSSITGTPLFTHIRYLMITTIPTMLITLVIFTIVGFTYDAASTDQISTFTVVLKEKFVISPWLLIVPAVTLFLIIKRVPAIITLFLSAIAAGIVALIAQPHILQEIAGSDTSGVLAQFKGVLTSFYGSTAIDTGNAELNELVSTRGMSGMLNTIWLIICAMVFGGMMVASGMLMKIVTVFIRFMRNTFSVVTSTVATGIFLNLTTADQYISIILTGNMFKGVYKRKGYESRLLSRTIEGSVTVTSPLVPWNTCGMTQSMIMGISTFVYLPYCFFNLLSPIVNIIVAALGYKIYKVKPEEEVEVDKPKAEKS